MNGFERSKAQLNVNGVPQSRVQDLGKDLMGLFGSVEKGVDTYNKVGEAGARLEFSSMYRDSIEELDMMNRQMKELPDDDVESRLQMASRMEEIKGEYTKKLADFSNHPAAYEVFATASSEALHSINSSYQTPMFESMQKAQAIKTTNEVSNEYSATGLNIVPSQAQSNLDKLKLIHNPEEADEQNKKLIGLGVMSTIATNDASFNPLEIMMQTTSTDKVTGMTLSNRNKIKDFINKNLLRGSEVAQLRVETGEDGVERFVVDGLLNDEDKLKIVQYADKYMGYAKAPEKVKSSSIILDATANGLGHAISGYDPENPMPTIREQGKQLENYRKTEEYQHLVENGSDEDKLKYTGMMIQYDFFAQKALLIESLIKNPSTSALAKLKSGKGYPISVKSQASYFDKDHPNARTTMYLSKGDADMIMGRIKSRADADYAQGNYPAAEQKYMVIENFTGEISSPASKLMQQLSNGSIPNFNSPEQLRNAVALIDASGKSFIEKTIAKQILSAIEFENGKMTLKSLDMFKATAQNIKNINNEVVRKVTASLTDTFGVNNTMPPAHTALAIQDLALTHKIDPRDHSEANIKRIAKLVEGKTATIDTAWFNDIVIYNKTQLTEAQLSKTVESIADKMAKGDSSVTDEKGKISFGYNPDGFVIDYGKTGKTIQFKAYGKDGRLLRKSKVFSLNQNDDDSIQKYFWNLNLPKKGK